MFILARQASEHKPCCIVKLDCFEGGCLDYVVWDQTNSLQQGLVIIIFQVKNAWNQENILSKGNFRLLPGWCWPSSLSTCNSPSFFSIECAINVRYMNMQDLYIRDESTKDWVKPRGIRNSHWRLNWLAFSRSILSLLWRNWLARYCLSSSCSSSSLSVAKCFSTCCTRAKCLISYNSTESALEAAPDISLAFLEGLGGLKGALNLAFPNSVRKILWPCCSKASWWSWSEKRKSCFTSVMMVPAGNSNVLYLRKRLCEQIKTLSKDVRPNLSNCRLANCSTMRRTWYLCVCRMVSCCARSKHLKKSRFSLGCSYWKSTMVSKPFRTWSIATVAVAPWRHHSGTATRGGWSGRFTMAK